MNQLEKTAGKVYKIGTNYYTISYSFSTAYVGSNLEIDKTSNTAVKLLNIIAPNGGTAGTIFLNGFYAQTVTINLTDVTQQADT